MKTREDKATCKAIGPSLNSRHFALFVQWMLTISVDEMVIVIKECGGEEEWLQQIEALLSRMSALQNESSQRGGFSPASDLGRWSVLRRTVGSRWRHSHRHITPHCRPEAARAADQAAAD